MGAPLGQAPHFEIHQPSIDRTLHSRVTRSAQHGLRTGLMVQHREIFGYHGNGMGTAAEEEEEEEEKDQEEEAPAM
eukprot:8037668-Pyramimonas_sp.AAC.1